MRNIVILHDRIHEIVHDSLGDAAIVACIATDKSASEVFVLTNTGRLLCFCIVDFTLTYRCSWVLDANTEDSGWFDVNYIAGTGSLVCISHSGSIVSIQDDVNTGYHSEVIEQIGAIDDGISTAKWNPDQSCLVIVTNVDTLILMSNAWDVLEEVPIAARISGSKTSVSWRGDGEFLSLVSTDKADGNARVRVLNRNLEVVATSRNVADGDASIMKGVGSAVAFAGNGSYIAVHQQRVKGKHQVALLERNGLRHGDFDIRTPNLPAGFDEWQVTHLEWDLPSNLLAVGLQAVSSSSSQTGKEVPSVVQIYYRNNYYWYLKQQWEGDRLAFLGFDVEVVNRLYISQFTRFPAVRVIDLVWDVCNSTTSADSTTVVVDGGKLLLTPLGISTVPPPMSLFNEQLSQCCRYPTIWAPHSCNRQTSLYEWGLCALGHKDSVTLLLGDKKGRVTQKIEIDLNKLLPDLLDLMVLRSAVCSHLFQTEETVHLNVSILGSRTLLHSATSTAEHPDNFTKDITADRPHQFDCVDELVSIHISLDVATLSTVKLVSYQVINGIAGSVTRLTSVPGDATALAMGVNNHIESTFDVYLVPLSASLKEVQHTVTLDEIGAEHLVSLPETCSHLSVIRYDQSEVAGVSEDPGLMVIALSQKNRLYCNETLLVVGASSFVYNANYQLLMYITLGTRPHLHFSSLAQLAALNPMEGVRDDYATTDFAEPRPVERGARLICSIANNSKVIIQLPRGNLELFEPRPLILMKAQSLMNTNQYLECLVLLRRQRVDLNYLIDFKPALFLQNVESFVRAAFTSNAELLSLLVSSIEPWDVTVTKYHLHSNAKRSVGQDTSMVGDDKVNCVCLAVRQALLPLLQAGQTSAINPILCTYAKQKPALLVEALQAIRNTNRIANPSATSLTTPIVLSSIKYLAFLADGQLLFDAALGECDFDMARGVGRQCQMDPKVYLPLLERFEKIGKGFESGSPQVALMHFRVNMHLNRYEKVVEYGVQLLSLLQSVTEPLETTTSADVVEAVRSLVRVVDQQDLFASALPKLYGVASSKKPSTGSGSIDFAALLTSTLSDVRVMYAEKCVSKTNYAEAVNAFLSARPARAVEAIQAARQLGNWQQALAIAGRYYQEERYKAAQNDIMPQRVAQSIVSEFRENLEQGESFGTEIENGAISSAVETAAHDDKVLEAARLCVEYCEDAEGAVSILTTAKRWMKAYQVALRYNRKDLQEEITASAVSSAKELLKSLPSSCAKFTALVTELSGIWADPADRLQKVSTTDAAVLEDLQGGPLVGEGGGSDTASEYSAVTQQSVMSYRSDAAASVRSGTSTVSILSQLSQQSQASSQAPSTSAFSIEGLDHSLLSRGKAAPRANNPIDPSAVKEKIHKRDNTPRGIKRKEKSKQRGGKDVWGLRRETAVSDELLSFSNVAAIASNVTDTCDLLVLLGRDEYVQQATDLHRALDAYIEVLTANPPPVAPLYPYEWLQRRAMLSVARYQDAEALKAAAVEAGRDHRPSTRPADLESWWKIAADGIKRWKTQQSVVFKTTVVV